MELNTGRLYELTQAASRMERRIQVEGSQLLDQPHEETLRRELVNYLENKKFDPLVALVGICRITDESRTRRDEILLPILGEFTDTIRPDGFPTLFQDDHLSSGEEKQSIRFIKDQMGKLQATVLDQCAQAFSYESDLFVVAADIAGKLDPSDRVFLILFNAVTNGRYLFPQSYKSKTRLFALGDLI